MTTVDTRRATWKHPRRARRQHSSTTTASPTAPTSARSTRTLFPTHVRRMVLDSNVDPRRVWYQANLDQDVAFERNMQDLVRVARQVRQRLPPGHDRAAVERAVLRAAGRSCDRQPAGGVVGRDEWDDIFLSAGYYQSTWPDLGDAVRRAGCTDHDSAPLVTQRTRTPTRRATTTATRSTDAVQCTDAPWPKAWARGERDNDRISTSAPFLTWGNAWYNAPCLHWPAKAGTPVKVDGGKAPASLLIDETLDAATPYSGSLEVRQLFPNVQPDRGARRHDARGLALRQRVRRRRRSPPIWRTAPCRSASRVPVGPTATADRCRNRRRARRSLSLGPDNASRRSPSSLACPFASSDPATASRRCSSVDVAENERQ